MTSSTASPASAPASEAARRAQSRQVLVLIVSWVAVSIPLAWGVGETLRKTAALFQ
jgi:hypothetical protein